VNLVQQANNTQPALIRLIGANGRYLGRSNTQVITTTGLANILLAVDDLIPLNQSLWQVANVHGARFDLVVPSNSSSAVPPIFTFCLDCNNLYAMMTVSNVTGSQRASNSPLFTGKRVDESVFLVNPTINGYDDIHLPFAQQESIRICPMWPAMADFMITYAINLETDMNCNVLVDKQQSKVAMVEIDSVSSNHNTTWTVNFIGNPQDGLVRFTTPDNYSLVYLPSYLLPTPSFGDDIQSGIVAAAYASNSTQTLWKLVPKSDDTIITSGQQLWHLLAYDMVTSLGSACGPISRCQNCSLSDVCGTTESFSSTYQDFMTVQLALSSDGFGDMLFSFISA